MERRLLSCIARDTRSTCSFEGHLAPKRLPLIHPLPAPVSTSIQFPERPITFTSLPFAAVPITLPFRPGSDLMFTRGRCTTRISAPGKAVGRSVISDGLLVTIPWLAGLSFAAIGDLPSGRGMRLVVTARGVRASPGEAAGAEAVADPCGDDGGGCTAAEGGDRGDKASSGDVICGEGAVSAGRGAVDVWERPDA